VVRIAGTATVAAGGPSGLPEFRRPTEADAVSVARELFLADERVDMNTVAGRLGVSRATLHRWVHTREHLLDEVLGHLAGEFLEDGIAHAREHPDDAVPALAHAIVRATSGSQPLRGFVAREPELALRLLLGEGAVRRRAIAGVQALVEEALPDEAGALAGFTEAVVEVALALEWATIVAGHEPSADRIAQLTRALLAGARAGELAP
jgi:AcrR family transcriptional regulator